MLGCFSSLLDGFADDLLVDQVFFFLIFYFFNRFIQIAVVVRHFGVCSVFALPAHGLYFRAFVVAFVHHFAQFETELAQLGGQLRRT